MQILSFIVLFLTDLLRKTYTSTNESDFYSPVPNNKGGGGEGGGVGQIT